MAGEGSEEEAQEQMQLKEHATTESEGRQGSAQTQARPAGCHHIHGAQPWRATAHGEGRLAPPLDARCRPPQALRGQPDAGAEAGHQGMAWSPAGHEQQRRADDGHRLEDDGGQPERKRAGGHSLADEEHDQIRGDGDGKPGLHRDEQAHGGRDAQAVESDLSSRQNWGSHLGPRRSLGPHRRVRPPSSFRL
jgi:hypothetical protein